LTDYDRETVKEVGNLKNEVESSLENFRFREALKYAMDLARLGNKYLADTEPWIIIKKDENRVKTIMNIALQITANLSVIMAPFLPFTVEKIIHFLNIAPYNWHEFGHAEILPAGHRLNKASLLFEKIDDETIDAQLKKLENTKTQNNQPGKTMKPQKEPITYDEFSKMDIRTGTIIEAERVPKANKLLVLKIDTGIDKRTVVSGIAGFFTPEAIVGKKVSILINLESRKIRGIESQGMILMAEDSSGRLTFVSPDESAENGSEVK